MAQDLKRISKFLSLILRHAPEKVGLTLQEGGWVEVSALLTAMQQAGTAINLPLLQRIVAEDEKQRYAFSADGTQIRANQGHSIQVELGLEVTPPPPYLYHGTATRFLESIRAMGLRPQSRTHVHLSSDYATAVQVGTRHGKPVVLEIRAGDMAAAGMHFYQAANGVWLTDTVPPAYFRVMDS